MCGIIGHVGCIDSSSIVEGLKNLEYRGYDSFGIAISDGKKIDIRKKTGMISESTEDLMIKGHLGIGHTRWATHGGVTHKNAHPHGTKKLAIVHNGVIENFASLKKELGESNFLSETDSEVIFHLIDRQKGPFSDSFFKALKLLKGSYAIVAMNSDEEKLYLARNNSPLIIGIGKNEMLCASDISAMISHTNKFVHLEDGDCAVLTKDSYKIFDFFGREITRKETVVNWNIETARKGGFPYFMAKEIHEQSNTIKETFLSDVLDARNLIKIFNRIDIIACGTSFHAGMILALYLTKMGKNAHAYIASDYPYITHPDEDSLIIAITQSGETADVLQAIKSVKCKKIAITNTVGSSITRLVDVNVFLNCGPEIGVAATKTFTSQLAIALKLVNEKIEYQDVFEKVKEAEKSIIEIARFLKSSEHVFFIARGFNVPLAMEGSLKFKEITYIHSEAYPGGELKHGTLSLISDGTPLVALAPSDDTLSKMIGNVLEVKARGGKVISITNSIELISISDYFVELPTIQKEYYPIVISIILQLLAYHVSVLRGINPDRPRNLAKSVTVE